MSVLMLKMTEEELAGEVAGFLQHLSHSEHSYG
jgi:hypothetical protein